MERFIEISQKHTHSYIAGMGVLKDIIIERKIHIMLNIGQIIYDYTNKRVVIFAGIEMLQNSKTGKCHSETGFILKDGTFIHLKTGEETPFKHTNLNIDGKPFIGTFVTNCECEGCFFGIIDGHNTEVKAWAKKAIEEVENLITKHGLNITKEQFGKKKYDRYHIGKSVPRKKG